MPKKLSELQKKEISKSFINGITIKEISQIYNFSAQTIIRQLKIILGEEKYKAIKVQKLKIKEIKTKEDKTKEDKTKEDKIKEDKNKFANKSLDNEEIFFEILPLNENIELDKRKDFSSRPIIDFDLPKVVYMLVDKKIELEPKTLREYPEWSFMPDKDLSRLTLEIFSDQKNAKMHCLKNQKIIKIPDSKVILTVCRLLKAKGISLIIYKDALLAL